MQRQIVCTKPEAEVEIDVKKLQQEWQKAKQKMIRIREVWVNAAMELDKAKEKLKKAKAEVKKL